MKYILNIENRYWRVKIRIGPQTVSKQFCWSDYGGQKKALKRAVDWRDMVLKRHGLLDRLKYKKSPDYFKQQQPKCPIIGVYLNYNPSTDKWNWIARYSINEKEYKRGFSVDKYGSKLAFQKACEVRFRYMGKLRIVDKSLMPCKPQVGPGDRI